MSRSGAVAERLGRGLQSLVQRFESARRLRHSESSGQSLVFESDFSGGVPTGERRLSVVSNSVTKRNSPSRWRFRPLHPQTVRFRVEPSGGASTYSRSVLGALWNLRPTTRAVK